MKHIYMKVRPDGVGENQEGDRVPYVILGAMRFSEYGIYLDFDEEVPVAMYPKPDYGPRSLADAWWVNHRGEASDRVVQISHLLYLEDVKGEHYQVLAVTAEALDGRPTVVVSDIEQVGEGDNLSLNVDVPLSEVVNIRGEDGFIRAVGVYEHGSGLWAVRHMI